MPLIWRLRLFYLTKKIPQDGQVSILALNLDRGDVPHNGADRFVSGFSCRNTTALVIMGVTA